MAVKDLLTDKTIEEKSNIKAKEIKKLGSIAKVKKGDYSIEILSINEHTTPEGNGGVIVLARAWDKNDNQIGFGKDGTVDIERFIIINPPILVYDPAGDIEISEIDNITGETIVSKLREDLSEAILQTLVSTIDFKKQKFDDSKIIKDKVGSTTLTAYSTSGNGWTGNLSATNWATSRSAAESDATYTGFDTLTRNSWISGKNGSLDNYIERCWYAYDTSSIGTDGIDSAVATWYAGGVSADTTGLSCVAVLIQGNQASTSEIVVGDYDAMTLNSPTELSDSRSAIYSTYSDTNPIAFTLNAAGESAIDKGSYTKFCIRTSIDVDDDDPGETVAYCKTYWEGQTGTSLDPKLVVEHTAAATGGGSNLGLLGVS